MTFQILEANNHGCPWHYVDDFMGNCNDGTVICCSDSALACISSSWCEKGCGWIKYVLLKYVLLVSFYLQLQQFILFVFVKEYHKLIKLRDILRQLNSSLLNK